MRHRVLDDESLDPVRMGQGHAKTNRAAVILHVKGIARESERFGKMIHDLGDVIEGICELFRVRPIAVPEARVIRRDKMILIRKPGEEWLEHSRRRRKSVQQEKDRRLFRSGFSIRSEERRVGKECRSWWSQVVLKKNSER